MSEFFGDMYACIMLTNAVLFGMRLVNIMRRGVEVGIVEGLFEEDWETGEAQFTTLNDRKFKMRNGNLTEVFCKGGSVMYPRPATDADGWELEPVRDDFFEDMFSDGTIHMVYIVVNGERVPLWTASQGWDNSKKFLNRNNMPFLKAATSAEDKGISPLKLLAAEAARDHKGVLAMREFEQFMDYETRNHVLSPTSWWIPL